MVKVIVLSRGNEEERALELDGPSITVGRSARNDIQINDRFVSRNHLQILFKGQRYVIKDLNSKNGTFVDGTRIPPGKPFEVQGGCPIVIGVTVICMGHPCSEDIDTLLNTVGLRRHRTPPERRMGPEGNIALIYELAKVLAHTENMHQVLERILDSALSLLRRIDRGAIVLLNPETGEIGDVVFKTKNPNREKGTQYSREVVDRVIQSGEAVMVSDSDLQTENDLPETLKLLRIQSVICVPMISKAKMRGVFYADSITRPYGFRREDLHLLNALSSPLAMAVENADLDMRKALKSPPPVDFPPRSTKPNP